MRAQKQERRSSGGDLVLPEWNVIPWDTEAFPKPDLPQQLTALVGPDKRSCCPLHRLLLCVDTLVTSPLLPPRLRKHTQLREGVPRKDRRVCATT